MKNKLIFLFFLLFTISGFAQETKYKEYSYTELFNMIEEDQDSVFELTDALIVFDRIKDKRYTSTLINGELVPNIGDTIVIRKEINFENVFFDLNYSLSDSLNRQIMPTINHLVFTKKLEFNNSYGGRFSNCIFKERFRLWNDENLTTTVKKVNTNWAQIFYGLN